MRRRPVSATLPERQVAAVQKGTQKGDGVVHLRGIEAHCAEGTGQVRVGVGVVHPIPPAEGARACRDPKVFRPTKVHVESLPIGLSQTGEKFVEDVVVALPWSLGGDAYLLQKVGLDPRPCQYPPWTAEAHLHELPEAAGVVVADGTGVPEGFENWIGPEDQLFDSSAGSGTGTTQPPLLPCSRQLAGGGPPPWFPHDHRGAPHGRHPSSARWRRPSAGGRHAAPRGAYTYDAGGVVTLEGPHSPPREAGEVPEDNLGGDRLAAPALSADEYALVGGAVWRGIGWSRRTLRGGIEHVTIGPVGNGVRMRGGLTKRSRSRRSAVRFSVGDVEIPRFTGVEPAHVRKGIAAHEYGPAIRVDILLRIPPHYAVYDRRLVQVRQLREVVGGARNVFTGVVSVNRPRHHRDGEIAVRQHLRRTPVKQGGGVVHRQPGGGRGPPRRRAPGGDEKDASRRPAPGGSRGAVPGVARPALGPQQVVGDPDGAVGRATLGDRAGARGRRRRRGTARSVVASPAATNIAVVVSK
mmetsp:Transcript_23351/g.36216  ORF Transcript_23351/g.36216 Transcript_23351/m.36216 type:complete len:523 (-) Transcript_23351:357-1925(-)